MRPPPGEGALTCSGCLSCGRGSRADAQAAEQALQDTKTAIELQLAARCPGAMVASIYACMHACIA